MFGWHCINYLRYTHVTIFVWLALYSLLYIHAGDNFQSLNSSLVGYTFILNIYFAVIIIENFLQQLPRAIILFYNIFFLFILFLFTCFPMFPFIILYILTPH